jgi:hypothetical protein
MTGNVLSAEHLPNTQGSSVITELTGIWICAVELLLVSALVDSKTVQLISLQLSMRMLGSLKIVLCINIYKHVAM